MFEPKIIAFLCTWCSYTGADTAGIARMKSPANVRAIRVPCSGRVSPELVMRSFDQGADGVIILGCHPGECHYDTGNHRTAKRFPVLHSLMTFVGLEAERLRLDWVSASEGERFARIVSDFTDALRNLGPSRWHRVEEELISQYNQPKPAGIPMPEMNCVVKTDAIRAKAKEILSSGEVSCVIGYEVGPRGHTRPSFASTPEEAEHLVWNAEATNNLTTYLPSKLKPNGKGSPKKVAVVVKPCDSMAINVMMAENQFMRNQVHVLGVACEGIQGNDGYLQTRCATCQETVPVMYDTMIGGATSRFIPRLISSCDEKVAELQNASSEERKDFWLSQFDRCIRCYACRQACPMCKCPTCLAERDDSLWVGMGTRLKDKRAFHLLRAYHLSGRCVGCNECERACPMGIPLSLLSRRMAKVMEDEFDFHAGVEMAPSPILTVLSGEYKEG